MAGGPDQVDRAATATIVSTASRGRLTPGQDRAAVVSFNAGATLVQDLTHDRTALEAALERVQIAHYSRLDLGIERAAAELLVRGRAGRGQATGKRSRSAGSKQHDADIEAPIDEHGRVRLLEPVRVGRTVRALVTILEPADDLDASGERGSTALSEPALAAAWLQASEDAAWEHLQPRQLARRARPLRR